MIRVNGLFQILLNYSGWFACVRLASQDKPAMAALIIFCIALIQFLSQLLVGKKTDGLLSLVIIFFLVGLLFDSMLVYQGLIIFYSNPFSAWVSPPWMWGIWLSFSVLFYATLMSLLNRQFLLFFLMFFGFSIAYFIGAELGAATFPLGYAIHFPVFAVLSGVLLLGLHFQQWIMHPDD